MGGESHVPAFPAWALLLLPPLLWVFLLLVSLLFWAWPALLVESWGVAGVLVDSSLGAEPCPSVPGSIGFSAAPDACAAHAG
jgi:hypothetical protein